MSTDVYSYPENQCFCRLGACEYTSCHKQSYQWFFVNPILHGWKLIKYNGEWYWVEAIDNNITQSTGDVMLIATT